MRVLGKYTHTEKLGKYAAFGVSTPYARKAHSARALKLQILHLARPIAVYASEAVKPILPT
jgi:hypothetical protein